MYFLKVAQVLAWFLVVSWKDKGPVTKLFYLEKESKPSFFRFREIEY